MHSILLSKSLSLLWFWSLWHHLVWFRTISELYFLAILAFKFIDPPRNVFQVSNLKWTRVVGRIRSCQSSWPLSLHRLNSLPPYFLELDIGCSFDFMLFPFPILQHFNFLQNFASKDQNPVAYWKDDSILL